MLDTATFYEEYWLKPKGQVPDPGLPVARVRNLRFAGADRPLPRKSLQSSWVTRRRTGGSHWSSWSALACGTAPVALVNDVLHEELTVQKLDQIIAGLPARGA